MEQILGMLSDNLVEMLQGVFVVLFGLLFMLIRSAAKRAPQLMLSFAENLAKNAEKTPGLADDAAAKLIKAIALALVDALGSGESK